MSLMAVDCRTFAEWEYLGRGRSARYDMAMLRVGGQFCVYADGWLQRRWALCKITKIYPNNFGGWNYEFDLLDVWFGDAFPRKEDPPYFQTLWTWFGIY